MATPMPPLSHLLSWSTEHLHAGADFWDDLATRWESSFDELDRKLLDSTWEGPAASTARDATHWDSNRISAAASNLRSAATIARDGSSDVDAAQTRLGETVSFIHGAGFDVADDYSVSDRIAWITFTQQVQRRAQAMIFAQEILLRATELVNTDEQIGSRFLRVVEQLDHLRFDEYPTDDVQVVHFVTPMQSPVLEPAPVDPENASRGPSAGDIRSVLELLPGPFPT